MNTWHITVLSYDRVIYCILDKKKAVFVQDWCRKYNLPNYIVEYPQEQRSTKAAFQERARKWRQYECQSIIAQIENPFGKYIATAHHRDDQVETLLLKLIRGAHITNLSAVSVFIYIFNV